MTCLIVSFLISISWNQNNKNNPLQWFYGGREWRNYFHVRHRLILVDTGLKPGTSQLRTQKIRRWISLHNSVEKISNPLHQQHHFVFGINFLYVFISFDFIPLQHADDRWPEILVSPPVERGSHVLSSIIVCVKIRHWGLACTLTRTPSITLSTGLKPVPGFGRMPFSLCLSQQELEGSKSVSYDDIAPADQPTIVNVGEKKPRKNALLLSIWKKKCLRGELSQLPQSQIIW